jgi:probable HAF family extracellular repeat protein
MEYWRKGLGKRRCKPFSRLFAVLAAVSTSLHAANGFEGAGFLPGGTYSYAYGISANGEVVVGHGDVGGRDQAYRRTPAGMSGLGFLPGGTYSYATGVSADGAVVVGNAGSGTGVQAFRWTTSGMTGLGFLAGNYSYATAVSGKGSVVVGITGTAGGVGNQAFRWTSTDGMTSLGFLAGGRNSVASALSADGSVIVGHSGSNIGSQAFRWTAGGMVGLGFLPGGTSSFARGVSADGSVVVGASNDAAGAQAFRWTSGGMVGLGFLAGGTQSSAAAVSADGNVVVGSSNFQAFRWSQGTRMQSVTDWLADAGISLPVGWSLNEATATNANGSVVVGNGGDPSNTMQGWIARVGTSGNGILTNLAAFNASLAEAASRGIESGAWLANMALFGAHHRSLLDSGLARTADGACAWATGDVAGRNTPRARGELAEIGVCKDLGETRLGLGIGTAHAQQETALGGASEYQGQYLIAEAATGFENDLEISILGYYANFDTSIRRNYLNGAAVDSSQGNPEAKTIGARIRVDWKNVAKLLDFNISPYAAYTWTETKLDSYTETGGGFPASYEPSVWRSTDLRVGGAGTVKLSGTTDLRLAVEAVHRRETSVSGANGQVLGVFEFRLPGQTNSENFARAIVDIDHRLSNRSLLTVSANSATSGGDAKWGISAGYRAAF